MLCRVCAVWTKRTVTLRPCIYIYMTWLVYCGDSTISVYIKLFLHVWWWRLHPGRGNPHSKCSLDLPLLDSLMVGKVLQQILPQWGWDGEFSGEIPAKLPYMLHQVSCFPKLEVPPQKKKEKTEKQHKKGAPTSYQWSYNPYKLNGFIYGQLRL